MDKTCNKCDEYLYLDDICNCQKYTILHNGVEYYYYALSIDDACKKFAEYWGVEINETMHIDVIDPNNNQRTYTISAEKIIHYIVQQVDKKTEGEEYGIL